MTAQNTPVGIRFQSEIVTSAGARVALAVGRILIGFYFFWAFIDKLFGLGFSTPAERAWVNGGAPAQGFLLSIEGPLASFFASMANPFVDFLFMMGLLGIGCALLLGIGLRIAAVTGTLLMFLMYLAELPLALGGTNPLIDSHWIYAALIIICACTYAGDTAGLGKGWGRLIGKNQWLR